MTAQPRKFPQLCLRLDLLKLCLEAGLADELLAAIRRVGEGGEAFLTLQTETGTLLLPLALEVTDL
ncbi:hypothetical protein [Calidithermus terrae]|uniref:hypothetical protein n=1 Tax=Calidithermus terrae TaxID=1408545 RepID=UPI000E6528DB|nr:hypothetical protein [Calidithermus terrae]